MKYFFLILVCYAVKCEDASNYFVVEMPEDDPPQLDVRSYKKSFQVYWNVPTMQCVSRKVLFQNLYEKFGIIQNDNDRFIGEKITILYEPGDFPAIFKNESSGKYRLRNGGVPQEGDLEEHLTAFKTDLNQSIPNPNFDGIGIIDFESWRPVFRQNFGTLVPYKDVSIEIEKRLHWWWNKTRIQAEATRRFEAAAKKFMQTTLSTAKQMRPKALWGYYGFPQCFNMANNNLQENCANNVPEENNGISWLWSESTALFPSIYSSVSLSASQLSSLIKGRVQESVRVRVKNTPVLPYFWFKYRDDGFMSQGDLTVALSTLYKSKASGFIIWGSSNDVNTLEKCKNLYNYVETVLGPNIAKYTKQINKIDDEIDENYTTTNEPSTDEINLNEIVEDTTASIRMGQMDPDYDWIPPKNYSEDISQQVDAELTKKGLNKTVNDEYQTLNQDDVMDLILDAMINAESNLGNKNVRQTKESDNENNYESTTLSEDPILTEFLTGSAVIDGITNNENLNEKEISSTESIIDGITNNENLNEKEISSTESAITSNEYTDSDKNIERLNEEIPKQGTSNNSDNLPHFDQSTQTYYESESDKTTEKNYKTNAFITENIINTNKFPTSSEERSDQLIIAGEPKTNDVSNQSEYIENERTDSDYLIIVKDSSNEETAELNKDEKIGTSQIENNDNDDFRETTPDLDQVVTYVYSQ